MTRLAGVGLGLLIFLGATPAAQFPARDVVTTRIGTATLTGVVTSESNQPLRHAVVTAAGSGTVERAAVTDDQGRFSIPALPAASYTITAAKPGYVTMRYGQKRPARGTGVSVTVAAGQTVEAGAIRLPKGAVIAGTITDETGRVRRGTQIAILEYRLVNGERQLSVVSVPGRAQLTTDDRGTYRAFGLPPGEYFVSATPPTLEGLNFGTELRRTTAAEVDWAERQVRGGATAAARPSAVDGPAPGPRVGLAPIYYPGTADPSQAMAIRLGPGEERPGVDVVVGFVPTAKVEGVVTAQDGSPVAAALAVVTGANIPMRSMANTRTDQQGRFTFAALPPGQFKLLARPTSIPPGGVLTFGMTDITVSGQDLSGVALTLQPGSVVRGRVAFEATSVMPADLTQFRVNLTRAGEGGMPTMGTGSAAARVKADGTFEIPGVVPGFYRLDVAGGPAAGGSSAWTVKTAVIAGQDAAETPFEIRTGDAPDVAISLTDRSAEISGTLFDGSGKPTPDYFVVAFSTNRDQWVPGSRRVRAPVRPSSDGKFRLPLLPAGTYYVAAATDVEAEDMADRAFLEQIAAGALTITLAEGEKKVQDFRLR